MLKDSKITLITFTICLAASVSGLGCSRNEVKRLVVENNVVVDLSVFKGCSLIVETSSDRILAFQLINNATLSAAFNFVKIHDGLTRDATYLTLDSRNLNPDVRHSELAYKTIYTKSNRAMIGVGDEIPEGLSMRISKAVDCPFNLGVQSQCARVFDAESCYCAIFTKRTWQEQNNFCQANGYMFLALESFEEEDAIRTFWETGTSFWMSLNDRGTEGAWVWDALQTPLYPGYANWNNGEPNDPDNSKDEDCGELSSSGRWNDADCWLDQDAICEKHP